MVTVVSVGALMAAWAARPAAVDDDGPDVRAGGRLDTTTGQAARRF
jgi:hypothetical protein